MEKNPFYVRFKDKLATRQVPPGDEGHEFNLGFPKTTYQYRNLIVGPVNTAAFFILSILSGFAPCASAGNMISFTVKREKMDKTPATKYMLDAILRPLR